MVAVGSSRAPGTSGCTVLIKTIFNSLMFVRVDVCGMIELIILKFVPIGGYHSQPFRALVKSDFDLYLLHLIPLGPHVPLSQDGFNFSAHGNDIYNAPGQLHQQQSPPRLFIQSAFLFEHKLWVAQLVRLAKPRASSQSLLRKHRPSFLWDYSRKQQGPTWNLFG